MHSLSNFILFLIFSVAENIATFAFIFSLFKFNYPIFKPQIVFISFVLAYFSYTIRNEYDVTFLDPFVQIILYTLFLKFMFKQRMFYSFLMTIAGALWMLVSQAVIGLIATMLKLTTINELQNDNSTGTYIVQIISILITLFASPLIKRKNWGFSFVNSKAVSFVGINRTLLITNITALLILGVTVYVFFLDQTQFLFYMTMIFLIVFSVIIFLNLKKDGGD